MDVEWNASGGACSSGTRPCALGMGMQMPCGAGERRMRLEGIRALDAQSIGMNFPAKGSIRLGRQ